MDGQVKPAAGQDQIHKTADYKVRKSVIRANTYNFKDDDLPPLIYSDSARRNVEDQQYLRKGEYHGYFSQGENVLVIEEVEEYYRLNNNGDDRKEVEKEGDHAGFPIMPECLIDELFNIDYFRYEFFYLFG